MHRNIILSLVFYGCETLSITLREERRLRVSENRALGKIFGSKRDKVAGKWRKLHNEKLYDLYFLPNISQGIKSRRMRWEGHVSRMRERTAAYRFFVRKPEGKRPLERPRRRWVDNIKMDFHEVGERTWTGLTWIKIGTGGGFL